MSNANRHIRMAVAALAGIAMAGGFAPRAALAAADPVDVTVTIQRFVEVGDPDSGDHGNYYGIVDIGGTGNYQDSRSVQVIRGRLGDRWACVCVTAMIQ
jgi:hypothetical protein